MGRRATAHATAHATANPEEAFAHPALFYQGPWEYLSETVPFIREGLAAGEPVAVAVPGPRLELLRDALGGLAGGVRLVDMSVAGRNPGRIIAEVLRAAVDAHPDKHVRVIGEPIWPGRSDLEYPACVQHEALINLAFAGRAATILCPYDVAGLDPAVIADAVATHPTLIQSGVSWPSPGYAPEQVIAEHNRTLPEPSDATVVPFDAARLRRARHSSAEYAERAGLAAERVDDVQLAVGEMAANSLRHGGGSGVLRLWSDAGHVVCEVADAGVIVDPLVGRRPASPRQLSGRGLLMVNHLADLVRMHTRSDGTVVRAHIRV
jgi:anti-sigma regulatory factor (Ser/Thr protein kinase)